MLNRVRKKIAIDAATIYPGKGGSGGGIWTYTKNILYYLDKQDLEKHNIEIVVFVNSEFSEVFNRIKIKRINLNTQGVFNRLLYVHFILPFSCYLNDINTLHKLATEVPIINTTNLVVTVHDFMTEYYIENNYKQLGTLKLIQQKYFAYITKHAINKSKTVITPSNAVRDEVKRRFNKEKVLTTELGCILNTEVSPSPKNDSIIYIYYVAGFYPHKGHIKAIELFELLVLKFNINAKLIFRGHISSSEYYQKVVNKLANSKCSNKIEFESYTKDSNLEEMYKKADFVMLLSEYEGFGLPILEAQTMKIPVIASNIQVIREVSNEYGCLINIEKIEEEVDKVYRFISDKIQLQVTIDLAYENASRFSWEANVVKLLNVYKED